jgi:hypothetical protein
MTRPDSRDFFVTVFVVVGFVRSIGAAAARVAPADASPSEKGGVVSENRVLHGEVEQEGIDRDRVALTRADLRSSPFPFLLQLFLPRFRREPLAS